MNRSVKHVEFIDHLRGIAIISVLFFHALSTLFGYDRLPWKGWFRDFHTSGDSFLYFLPFSVGNVGVPIFFVVSGFCIHMSFHQQGQRWGSFFIRRIFRIYPAYLAALVFTSLLLYSAHIGFNFHRPENWKQILTHLFLIHNLGPQTLSGLNGPFWSLAIEAQLYLLYPALLVLVAKLGWRRSMFLLGVVELLIRGTDGLIRGTDGVVPTIDDTNTPAGHISWLFASSPLGYWFSWSLGAFIADAFLKNQTLPFAKISPVWWLALAIVSYFVKPLTHFHFLLFALTTAVVVSKLLSGARPEIKVPPFLLVVLKKIGLWSYSIYLLHWQLLQNYSYFIDWVVPAKFRSVPVGFLLVLATWLPTILLAFLWYRFFERPGIALGKRIIQKANFRDGTKVESESSNGGSQAWIVAGRYYLMLCALLAIVFGSLLISEKLIAPPPAEYNEVAWSLATSPEATNRDGALAVELAEDACQRTQYKETVMVGTLAAAYAEAGRFDEAILTAQQACALAKKNGETNLLQENQELLALYQKHQPFRDLKADTRK